MRVDVLGAPKNIDHVDVSRHVDQAAEHRTAEDLLHFGKVDGYRNHFQACLHQVLRNVEGGLTGLLLGLDAEDRNPPRLPQQVRQDSLVPDQVVLPAFAHWSLLAKMSWT